MHQGQKGVGDVDPLSLDQKQKKDEEFHNLVKPLYLS